MIDELSPVLHLLLISSPLYSTTKSPAEIGSPAKTPQLWILLRSKRSFFCLVEISPPAYAIAIIFIFVFIFVADSVAKPAAPPEEEEEAEVEVEEEEEDIDL